MARELDIGKLRQRITFLTPPIDKDDYGELIINWPDFKTVWASKEPIIGRELFTALTTDAKVEVKFRCRYVPGISNDMRIRHRADVYEIISAIDVESVHKELLCYCKLARDDRVNV